MDMNYKVKYEQWLDSPIIDSETKDELRAIAGDEKEIEDRFYKDLEFGTGGLRGIIGAGSNRMNYYTVGKATQGLAHYIIKQGKEAMDKGVVIAYDSRRMSREFADRVALVLNANGIKAYVYSELQPTPVLSFSVRELRATAGIVVTASHNPPQYNGYKVYWDDGGQIPPQRAEEIIQEIQAIENLEQILTISKVQAVKQGLFNVIGEEVLKKYIDLVAGLCVNPELVKEMGQELKIIYTPLHGAGNKPVRRVLNHIGFGNLAVVPEQELPDPDFSTVDYPNPEERKAFELAINMGERDGADIIIGTDPDCDRVGAVVKDRKGEYVILSGNQIGALLVDYILRGMARKGILPQNGKIIKTIVTSEMGRQIAKSYGVGTIDTLTGFKFIGEKMKEFEENGHHVFLFGYEESYGYLAGDFVRDKDAVIASMLICEMAAYYESRRMSLYEGLIELWDKYGYYQEELVSMQMEGREGMERIGAIMGEFRTNPPKELNDIEITIIADYKEGKEYNLIESTTSPIELPNSDVLRYTLADGSWFCIRPSGTEPKVKLYFSVVGKNIEDAKGRMDNLISAVMARVQ